jgi:hypothetical protein
MRKSIPVLAVMAIVAALTACNTRDNRTPNQTGSTVPPAQTAPPMTAAPADTAPSTAVTPMPAPKAAEGAPTAKDTPNPDPLKGNVQGRRIQIDADARARRQSFVAIERGQEIAPCNHDHPPRLRAILRYNVSASIPIRPHSSG